jgi:4-amino-4-deoxy-L-arabinose transferase-like glycosyltransferase
MNIFKQQLFNHRYALSFWILVLIRSYFNAVLPLMDKTEARYGEIARLMSETGNWITPQIDYGLPFWAKPPLSTWTSALSVSIFGSAEFFVRLPYLIVFVGLALFIGKYTKGHVQSYYLLGIITLSIPEFYLHAGVISTDTFLTCGVSLSMLGFWEALRDEAKPYWGYLFFAGMGIGLLSKGPIVGILTLPPIFLWALVTKNIQKAFNKLPWIGGVLLMLALILPWYVMAEINSPGFIDYFIVGEHFERYFNSGWKGDKYGFPKQQPIGIVWAFLILFLLPWSIAFVRLLIKKGKDGIQNPWVLFLLFWALWTPLFFTSSKSLIHPYILPSSIPVALIISHYWSTLKNKRIYLGFALGLPFLLFAVHLSGKIKPLYASTTDKYLIEQANPALDIFSLDQKSYSSQFYTNGNIKQIDTAYLGQLLKIEKDFYLILLNKQWRELKTPYKNQLDLIDCNSKKGLYQFKDILKY